MEDPTFSGYPVGSTFSLAFEATGRSLRGYLDGELVVQGTDSALERGAVGLYTRRSTGVEFDRIDVTPTVP